MEKRLRDTLDSEFAEFWAAYPVKRDRLDALRAYQKARKGGATHAAIMAGIDAYRAHKPAWQAFKHAATWLNKGGYLDEWESGANGKPAAIDWFVECREVHGGDCGLDRWRHTTRMQMGIPK